MIDREKSVSTATIHDEILKAAATITTSTRVRFFQTYSVSPNNRCFKILANPIPIQILLHTQSGGSPGSESLPSFKRRNKEEILGIPVDRKY